MKKLPPFDKGGQGGFIRGRHEKSNPPRSPFFKGGSGRGAIVCCDSREAMLFVESVAAPAAESSGGRNYRSS